jgi:hypothetical protein
MLRKIDCVMIRVEDVDLSARTMQRSLVCVQSGVETGRLVSFFQRPMLKLYFTARRLFLHRLKSIT